MGVGSSFVAIGTGTALSSQSRSPKLRAETLSFTARCSNVKLIHPQFILLPPPVVATIGHFNFRRSYAFQIRFALLDLVL